MLGWPQISASLHFLRAIHGWRSFARKRGLELLSSLQVTMCPDMFKWHWEDSGVPGRGRLYVDL